MSIYKKKNSPYWWVDITIASGERIRRSAKTSDKKKAKEYHDRLKAELWDESQLGQKPIYLFEDGALMMLKLAEGQSDYKTKVRHVKYWRSVFSGRSLESLNTEEILHNLPTHRTFESRKPIRLTNSTKNRYLSTIKRILSLAEQSKWITVKPHIPTFKEPAKNIRWITKPEAQALLRNISLPWLHDVCLFALMTGARANEIFTLTWDKVSVFRKVAWLTNDLTKSEKSRALPLNDEALRLIMSRPKNHKFVFCRDTGLQLTEIDRRAFNRAVQMTGLAKMKFHDLRHTWASWHAQEGTPLMILKELGGWEKLEMVQKYAHLAPNHLAEYVQASEIMAPLRHTEVVDKKNATLKVA